MISFHETDPLLLKEAIKKNVFVTAAEAERPKAARALTEDFINVLILQKPRLYIYLSKFFDSGMTKVGFRDLLREFIKETEPFSPSSKMNESFIYKNLDEYRSTLTGVSEKDLNDLREIIVERGVFPTVKELIEFTLVTKELPGAEIELRWLIVMGNNDD